MRIAILLLTLIAAPAFARGGGGHSGSHSGWSSHSHISADGTGSKSEHEHVSGYVKKDGTYVAPHEKSTPDHTKNNNWDTKGNTNPYTGKDGTQRGDSN